MASPRYDARYKTLLFPERRPVFVDVDSMPSFDVSNVGLYAGKCLLGDGV